MTLKITKRRGHCEDCKAWCESLNCTLGYKTTGYFTPEPRLLLHNPGEPCPRPLTIKTYCSCVKSEEFNKKLRRGG